MAKQPMGLGSPEPIGAPPAPPMHSEPDGDEANATVRDLVSQLAEALGGHCEWGEQEAGEPDEDDMGGAPPEPMER